MRTTLLHLHRHDVCRRQRLQVLPIHLLRVAHTPTCMLQIDSVQLVGYESGIAPRHRVPLSISLLQHQLVLFPCRAREVIVVLTDALLSNVQQFLEAEVGKLEAVWKSGVQSRVHLQEFHHGLLVSTNHHCQVALLLVSQQVHQQLNHHLARVVGVLSVQQISLVQPSPPPDAWPFPRRPTAFR